ncbi:RAMP superfamily CRISPR-associated protein [Teredinibacter turnerae]|uniref:RAMP superfamily CRISPR-associated protein n=1 Tax=Teredinibacter turnerae TaxID=2426 RepID=UPI0003A0863F|nr:RAMP superfamily CRISPR-associated protein [Teredinibacter turnerae]
MNTATPSWRRVKITGRLKVSSPLHIGNGQMFSQAREIRNSTDDIHISLVSEISCTREGCPYIPASSLKGALRSRLNEEAADALFGSSHEEGSMGKLRVYCALAIKLPDLSQRTGVAIDTLHGTAFDHKLYTHQIVPKNTEFALEIEAENLNKDELSVVLGLLDSLNGSPGSGIGAGKSKDQGRLQWYCDGVQTISLQNLGKWCRDQRTNLPWERLDPIPSSHPLKPMMPALGFTLIFSSAWLIDEPTRHRPATEKDPNPPHLEFSRSDTGEACVPASSIKGWLRSHTQRILTTLLADDGLDNIKATSLATKWLAHIFGDTSKASWLLLSDAFSANPVSHHTQQFNAIDRFTGGGKTGALYCVNAASPTEVHGKITVRTPPNDSADWRLGLLILVVRDAMQGDLKLGWGKSRGYGHAHIQLHRENGSSLKWPELVREYDEILQTHIEAFHHQLTLAQDEIDD